jgi:hypothetical protein
VTRVVAVPGVDLIMRAGGGLVELGSGQMLALEVVGARSKTVTQVVPAGVDGPQVVLW